jgi:hypothetical protein
MPHGIKGWAAFVAGQAVFTAIWKSIYKLLENAMIGWGDDQIAAYFGITSPTAATAFSWLLPLLLAGLTLWLYHLAHIRIAGHSAVPQSSGDHFSGTGIVGDRLPARTWIQKVEPYHVIILGLLIATGGVAWMLYQSSEAYRNSKMDRAAILIAPFQAQIDSLNRQIASLKSPSHPTNPVLVTPAKISRIYSPADVRNLLDALTDAQKIVDEVISPPYFRVENLMVNHQLLNGTQQFAGTLTELRDQIKNEVWPKVDDFVYKKNAAYKEEMEFAFALEKEATKGAMLRKLDIAIDAIKKLPPNPGPDLAQLVKPQMKAVADEIQPKVYDWIGSSRRRIVSMTGTLEKDGTINYDAK